MSGRTENTIDIAAPLDLVWDITNDLAEWPHLFSEYASVDVLESSPDYVRFRLTMYPDKNGTVWSWVSERRLDRARRTVEAQRVETGPFAFMKIRWVYTPIPGGTRMTWVQHFEMKPDAPVDDTTMAARIDANTPGQMARHKAAVERAAGIPLAGRTLPGIDGTVVGFDALRGCPLVVILGNRHTQKIGHGVIEALRSHPRTVWAPVVQVADLHGLPGSLQAMASRHILAGYRGQLADLAERRRGLGWPPADESQLLKIALDWDGEVTSLFGFGAADRRPLVLVFDGDQRLLATIADADVFPAVREVLAELADTDKEIA